MPTKDDIYEQVEEEISTSDRPLPNSEQNDKYLIDHRDYNPISQQDADPSRDEEFKKGIKPKEVD